ncbi:MAG: DUF5666 domain-containing protein [candidate division KSB1 bacterium]|nr:DUF5666 domain-containing protein [candidate division KSB1 bacterium]MDZ7299576.1 DUF5666 domain-containing protein [candidate division KSB1 bacterium]MDZ7350440.1 DUF5666 domain-containing protein [candidate division KSB1 bacterium]MDZ7354812.1 DUF5666 domain-containing protein [candidate division KSB1 bacterium]MDZ7397768.1 DUF5666 domain-containing protein [candidate division KSB1 bacterium]
MHKFSTSEWRVAVVAIVLLLATLLGGCGKTPTDAELTGGSELNKLAAIQSTPSPTPSPSPTTTPAPGATLPFETFCVREAKVEWKRDAGDQRFEVEGLLLPAGLLISLRDSSVTVVFGDLSVTIAGSSFVRDDDNDGFKFKNQQAGITEIEFKDDGRYEIEGRGLSLGGMNLREPVLFALQIGSRRGEFKIPFDSRDRFKNPNPCPRPTASPSPSPTVSPSPEPTVSPSPSPTVSPSPEPTVSPSPSPTVSPSPEPTVSPSPSPTVSPSPEPTVSPSPSPTVSPSPEPTVSPSPSPTVSPSPEPTVSPSPSPTASPSPEPTASPSPSPTVSPSPELHLEGAIQALVIRGAYDGEVTVKGVKFIVTQNTRLQDEEGGSVALHAFVVGEEVDAWGTPAVQGVSQASKIRKD